MRQYTVQLKSVSEIKEFVQIVNHFPFDVDLSSGRYVVDAKSIMGIFSLDLSKPINVAAYCDDCAEFEARLKPFFI